MKTNSAALARLASCCFNARIRMPFAASRPLRVMAIAPRAVAPASATVCALMIFFVFPFAALSYFPMIGKHMKNCMTCPPKNDSRGPTFDLNFSPAIGWIQAWFALPLAQTTSGGEGWRFFSIYAKQFSPRKIRIERKKSRFHIYFIVFYRKNPLEIKKHPVIPSVCTHYMCLSNAIIQFVFSVE